MKIAEADRPDHGDHALVDARRTRRSGRIAAIVVEPEIRAPQQGGGPKKSRRAGRGFVHSAG